MTTIKVVVILYWSW